MKSNKLISQKVMQGQKVQVQNMYGRTIILNGHNRWEGVGMGVGVGVGGRSMIRGKRVQHQCHRARTYICFWLTNCFTDFSTRIFGL